MPVIDVTACCALPVDARADPGSGPMVGIAEIASHTAGDARLVSLHEITGSGALRHAIRVADDLEKVANFRFADTISPLKAFRLARSM